MDEERKEEAAAQGTSDQSPSAGAGDDLAQEVNRLVEAMARAARNAWSSEQRQQLETDLRGCLGTLVANLEEALTRFSRSEQGQELQEKATRAANRLRESFPSAELQNELTKGMKTAANEVQKFADSLEKQQAASDSPQDIPVESDNEGPERDREL